MEHVGMKKGSKAKVRNSFGVYDIYKLIRKNGWKGIGQPVSEKDFYAIIRGINLLIADNIANGQTVHFPFKMGVLELRKYQTGVSFEDGKLKNRYPIDWYNTLLLWDRDKEAKEKKIRLRHENKWVYHVKYDNWKAGFNNKVFYRFALNTFIKRALSKNIKSGKVDTLW
jgi:hypothetical protein